MLLLVVFFVVVEAVGLQQARLVAGGIRPSGYVSLMPGLSRYPEAGGEMLFRLLIAISSNYGSRGGMIRSIARNRFPLLGFLVDSTIIMDYFFFFFGNNDNNSVNFEKLFKL